MGISVWDKAAEFGIRTQLCLVLDKKGVMGKQRQADAWRSLASQSNQRTRAPDSVSDPVSKNKQPRCLMPTSGFHMHVDTCVWVYVHTHTPRNSGNGTGSQREALVHPQPLHGNLGCFLGLSAEFQLTGPGWIRLRFPKFSEAPLEPCSPHPSLLSFRLHHHVFFYYLQRALI